MILLLLVGLVLGVGPAAVLVEVLARGGRLLPRHLHIVAINVQLLCHQLLARLLSYVVVPGGRILLTLGGCSTEPVVLD